VAHMGEGRGVYRVLVGRPDCKRPLGRPRRRWEDNIKMDLREIGIDGANWFHLSRDRVHWRADPPPPPFTTCLTKMNFLFILFRLLP
jgi:hypothetical protein